MARPRPPRYSALVLGALAAASAGALTLSNGLSLLDQPAFADCTWATADGVWSNSNNWSPNSLPTSFDWVTLSNSDAISRTVSLDTNAILSWLTLDSTSTSSACFTLSQSANTFSAGSKYVGYFDPGCFTQTCFGPCFATSSGFFYDFPE